MQGDGAGGRAGGAPDAVRISRSPSGRAQGHWAHTHGHQSAPSMGKTGRADSRSAGDGWMCCGRWWITTHRNTRRCVKSEERTSCGDGKRYMRIQLNTNVYQIQTQHQTQTKPKSAPAQIQIQTQNHPQIHKHIHPHSQKESGTGLLKTSEIVENRKDWGHGTDSPEKGISFGASCAGRRGRRPLRSRGKVWYEFAGGWRASQMVLRGTSRTPSPTSFIYDNLLW